MARATKSVAMTESWFCEESMPVDREKGVIRNVKFAGLESLNGRSYRPSAYKEALSLYEGAKVNVNHPKGKPSDPRDYQDRLGVARNVRYVEGKGVFGDLHYNPKHALAEQLAWDAENNPTNVGFSHNIDGNTSSKGGKLFVEGIAKVRSIDLVADPATAASLYEHADSEVTVTQVVEAYRGSESPLMPLLELMAANPAYAQATMPQGPNPLPQPGMAPAAPSNPALREALKSLLSAFADDSALDDTQLMAELKKMATNILGASSAPADEDNPFDDSEDAMSDQDKKPAEGEDKKKLKPEFAEAIQAAVSEATKPLVEQLAVTSKELDARRILEGKGANVTPQLLAELTACADKAAMELLVEGWSPAKLGKQKPFIKPAEVTGDFPTGKAFLEYLRG